VALLLGLSGHRDPRRTHTASARRPTLPAVLNVVQPMARFPVLGHLAQARRMRRAHNATGSATPVAGFDDQTRVRHQNRDNR